MSWPRTSGGNSRDGDPGAFVTGRAREIKEEEKEEEKEIKDFDFESGRGGHFYRIVATMLYAHAAPVQMTMTVPGLAARAAKAKGPTPG